MAFLSKTYRKILVALLTALGFSGAVIGCDDWKQRAEYGVPSADYKAKGVVVSETDGTPIQGICAVLRTNQQYEEFTITLGSALTNSKGNFNVGGSNFPYEGALYVELTDVDGEANGGLFASAVIKADPSNTTFTGGSGWHHGKTEINLGTIIMELENK